ncbi:MAG: hypothetical protein AAF628_19910 [Planctomycetota bacterium]
MRTSSPSGLAQLGVTATLWLIAPCGAQNVVASGYAPGKDDAMGRAVAAIGDTDRDGVVDWAVGAPRDDRGGSDRGTVTLYSGMTGKPLRKLQGVNPGDNFGYAVASAGDVDGDGNADILVGAPHEDNEEPELVLQRAGCVRVLSGRNGDVLRLLRGRASRAAFGWSVANVGDVNRDGHQDYAVGSPFFDKLGLADVGAVHLYSGRNGDLIRVLEGEEQGARFGWSISGLDDINRDRCADIAIGAEGAGDGEAVGIVHIYSGRNGRLVRSLECEQPGAYFGSAVAAAGDHNKDRRGDVLVGAWNAANAAQQPVGAVFVFSAKSGKQLRRLEGDGRHDHFGAAVAKLDDLDGDGRPEIAVGAPQDPARRAGYVKVFSSATGDVMHTFLGERRGDSFGTSLRQVGEPNADGAVRLLVGAPGAALGGGWKVFLVPKRSS